MTPPVLHPLLRGAPGALSIIPRPAPDADLADLRAAGIDTVISLLEPAEAAALGLADEAARCHAADLVYLGFPIADMKLPDRARFSAFAADLAQRIHSGRHLAVHCRASIGRTGMLTCATLGHFGYDARSALDLVSAARGVTVPDTPQQAAFIRDLLRPTT